MSSRQLDDMMDEQFSLAVAKALGIDVNDLESLDWSHEPVESGGAIIGYNIEFGEGADPDILADIDGLPEGQNWIRLSVLELDLDEQDEPDEV